MSSPFKMWHKDGNLYESTLMDCRLYFVFYLDILECARLLRRLRCIHTYYSNSVGCQAQDIIYWFPSNHDCSQLNSIAGPISVRASIVMGLKVVNSREELVSVVGVFRFSNTIKSRTNLFTYNSTELF